MNTIKEKILELPCYENTHGFENRIYTEEMQEQCAEVAQAEMDALIAEIKSLKTYEIKHMFTRLPNQPVHKLLKQSEVMAIIDKWNTK